MLSGNIGKKKGKKKKNEANMCLVKKKGLMMMCIYTRDSHIYIRLTCDVIRDIGSGAQS
jgi:hypothetical protein